MEFAYDDNGVPFLQEDRLSFRINTPETGLFTLKQGTVTLTTLPAVPGDYPETMALQKKCRPHASADGSECSLDTESYIPFGTEPAIERKYTFTNSRMTVRTDFVLRHSFEIRSIVGGGWKASGIKHFKISCKGSKAGAPNHEKTIDFQSLEDGATVYDKEHIPLILRLVGMDNKPLDFELGASVWRWDLPSRLPGKARFIIRKEKDSLCFYWNLFEYTAPAPEAVPPHGRNLRFIWSLNWGTPEKIKTPKAVFDTEEYQWPESAKVMGKDGKTLENLPCFQSAKVLEILKSWLRSNLADAEEGDTFVLRVPAEDSVCCSAAHEDRPRKELLIHWDRDGKLDFQRWANRQLLVKGAKLVIQHKEKAK